MTKKNYTVMGATGQIGRVVAEQLLKQGHHVKAMGRDRKKLDILQSKGAETICVEGFHREGFLTAAFTGVDAVFVMIPPGYGTENYGAYQDEVGEAIVTAIQKSSIHGLVNLSSLGAHLPEGTGPIKGLYRQEQRLNQLKNLSILHLRPSYFMENFLWSIPVIKQTGMLKSPLEPHLSLAPISTQDIGIKAAEFLSRLDFKEHSVFELVGPRSLTLVEMAKILGAAIGMPNLEYVQLSYEEAKKGMLSSGMGPSSVELMIEMYKAFNANKCIPTQTLTREHRGKMTPEQFAQTFAQIYKSQDKQKVAS